MSDQYRDVDDDDDDTLPGDGDTAAELRRHAADIAAANAASNPEPDATPGTPRPVDGPAGSRPPAINSPAPAGFTPVEPTRPAEPPAPSGRSATPPGPMPPPAPHDDQPTMTHPVAPTTSVRASSDSPIRWRPEGRLPAAGLDPVAGGREIGGRRKLLLGLLALAVLAGLAAAAYFLFLQGDDEGNQPTDSTEVATSLAADTTEVATTIEVTTTTAAPTTTEPPPTTTTIPPTTVAPGPPPSPPMPPAAPAGAPATSAPG